MNPKEVFETIYEGNSWNGTDSVSGKGSDLEQTAHVAEALPKVMRQLGAASILDIPCGDFYWMQHVNFESIQYIGADIVADLVERNQSFANDSRSFVHCDLLCDELPQTDVIFCRDCLVHFSDSHVWQALTNIATSQAKYLITTTFLNRTNDKKIETGQWRPLNLQAAPFNLPMPMHIIDEQCTHDDGAYPDKMLGVWSVADIQTILLQSRLAA